MIKTISAMLTILLLVASCKKDSNNSTTTYSMETGIYEGTYSYTKTNTFLYKFKVEVTSISATKFQIKQLDSANVPILTMDDKNHNYPFINFLIPTQTYNGINFSGNGNVSGGFDALFNTTSKSLYFSINLSNDPYKMIIFNGNKK